MKRILFLFVTILSCQLLMAQNEFKFGPVIGVNTSSVEPSGITDIDSWQDQLGYRVGLFARIPMGAAYLQPSLILRTSGAEYQITDLGQPGNIEFLDENYLNFDIPAVVGAKLLFLRLHAGPVASIRLNTNSKLFDEEGYERTFDRVHWGLMLGTGVDIWKFALDVNYQMPIVNSTDGLRVNGQEYGLNSQKGQLVFTLGYDF